MTGTMMQYHIDRSMEIKTRSGKMSELAIFIFVGITASCSRECTLIIIHIAIFMPIAYLNNDGIIIYNAFIGNKCMSFGAFQGNSPLFQWLSDSWARGEVCVCCVRWHIIYYVGHLNWVNIFGFTLTSILPRVRIQRGNSILSHFTTHFK